MRTESNTGDRKYISATSPSGKVLHDKIETHPDWVELSWGDSSEIKFQTWRPEQEDFEKFRKSICHSELAAFKDKNYLYQLWLIAKKDGALDPLDCSVLFARELDEKKLDKNRWTWSIGFLILGIVASWISLGLGLYFNQKDITALKNEIQSLKTELLNKVSYGDLNTSKANIEAMQGNLIGLRNELHENMTASIQILVQDINNINTNITKTDAKIISTIQDFDAKITETTEMLKKLLNKKMQHKLDKLREGVGNNITQLLREFERTIPSAGDLSALKEKVKEADRRVSNMYIDVAKIDGTIWKGAAGVLASFVAVIIILWIVQRCTPTSTQMVPVSQ